MKRKTLAILVVLILFILIPIMFSKLSSSMYKSQQIDLFNSTLPCDTRLSTKSTYIARYEMSHSDWKELENKLVNFSLTSTSGTYPGECMLPQFEDDLFTADEISNMTNVYYLSEHKGLPLFKHWIETLIIICPNDTNVSVYFATMDHSSRTK